MSLKKKIKKEYEICPVLTYARFLHTKMRLVEHETSNIHSHKKSSGQRLYVMVVFLSH